jgi:hypothetical protein
MGLLRSSILIEYENVQESMMQDTNSSRSAFGKISTSVATGAFALGLSAVAAMGVLALGSVTAHAESAGSSTGSYKAGSSTGTYGAKKAGSSTGAYSAGSSTAGSSTGTYGAKKAGSSTGTYSAGSSTAGSATSTYSTAPAVDTGNYVNIGEYVFPTQ